MADITETNAIANLATAGKRFDVDGTPFVLDGHGTLQNLSNSLKAPLRIVQARTFTAIDSFISYVNKFRTKNTAMFASVKDDTLAAEIDSHGVGEPSHGTHDAELKLEKTLAMKSWIANNGKQMSQHTFARFLEDNASDIVSPAAGQMVEVARHIQAVKTGSFEQKVDLDNGSYHFTHSEDVRGTIKKGRVEVPTAFQIGVVVYRGQKGGLKIDAKFRFKLEADGTLSLWYVIPQLDRILDDAFNEVVASVGKETKLEVLHGS